MKLLLITILTMSTVYAYECSNDDLLKIKDTDFEEKIIENDPRLCFNKEKLKIGIDIPYREKLKSTFQELDKVYSNDLEISKRSASALSGFSKISSKLGSLEILGLTRMDTKNQQPGANNRSWDYFDLESGNGNVKVRSPIHEFIGDSKHINKNELTDEVISQMDRYSQTYKCKYGAQIAMSTKLVRLYSHDIEPLGIESKYKDSNEFKESLKTNKATIDKLFNYLHPQDEGIERNYNCPEDYDTRDNSISYQAEDSCNIQVSHKFKNNSSEISPEILKSSPGYAKFMNCFNQKKLTQKLKDIDVTASSSSLRNTSEEYGQYDWKKLSDDRANNTAQAFYNILNPDGSKENYKSWEKSFVNTNSNGDNGDGSSGPCALEWKNGKVVQKSKYMTPKGRKSLEKFKTVTLSARFDQNVKDIKKEPRFYFQKRCKAIHYKCREYTDGKTSTDRVNKLKKSVNSREVFRTHF